MGSMGLALAELIGSLVPPNKFPMELAYASHTCDIPASEPPWRIPAVPPLLACRLEPAAGLPRSIQGRSRSGADLSRLFGSTA